MDAVNSQSDRDEAIARLLAFFAPFALEALSIASGWRCGFSKKPATP